MGTRSITRIVENGRPLLTFYRQFDGYPEGHGRQLADFMAGITIVNGISLNMKGGTHANGAGCFAGQLLAKLKLDDDRGGIGGIYVVGHDTENEEYTYTISLATTGTGFDSVDAITAVKCEGYDDTDSYDGDLAGFVAFCARGE